MDTERELQVTHVLRRLARSAWGGTETVATELAAALLPLGARSEICCTRALEPAKGDVVRGTPVRRFGYFYPFLVQGSAGRRKFDDKGGNPIAAGLQLHLLRRPADLFHAHAVGRIGATVRNAARFHRVPYVVSLHGGWVELPAAQLERMGRSPGMRFDFGWTLHPLFPQRRVLAEAAHILCVGAGETEAIARLHPRVPVSYVPNGVDVERFGGGDGRRFRSRLPSAADPVLLCVARIDSQKNQRVLVRALAALRRERPSAHVVLLGSVSEESYLREIRDDVRSLGLLEAVTILPGVGPDDPALADAYAGADVVVLPSAHEPFGVAVLEAWSAEKPVVVSRVGGLAHLVEEGLTGRLVPVDDERALANALGGLLDDPSLAAAMGGRGRRRVEETYSWAAHAERTLRIYEDALRGSRR